MIVFIAKSQTKKPHIGGFFYVKKEVIKIKNIRAALHEFWNSFHVRDSQLTELKPIPAYPEHYAVEETAKSSKSPEFPYITYGIARPSFGDFTIVTNKIYTFSTSWALVDDVLEQAAKKIPEHGKRLSLGDDGVVVLYRSNPFSQYMPPEERLAPGSSPMSDLRMKVGLISVVIKSYLI